MAIWAPGRVNLIGEHTDYTGGLAFPMAIQLGIELRGRVGGNRLRLETDIGIDPLDVALPIDDLSKIPPRWRIAAATAARAAPTTGLSATLGSTLPASAGLSSSAAVEAAMALALGAPAEDPRTALLCQLAEHDAGTPCGLLDQLAVICGREGHGMLIDFHTGHFDHVQIPPDAQFVVVPSGQERDLRSSPYAQRLAECHAAGDLVDLRSASIEDLEAIDDPAIRRRARHVVTENRRVREFGARLAEGDLPGAGELMSESHRSLRDDFEVSTPVLDALVSELLATPGVLGARLTGAGFGGCVVALCEAGVELGRGWAVVPSTGAHRLAD